MNNIKNPHLIQKMRIHLIKIIINIRIGKGREKIMGRPTTKADLITAANDNFVKLNEMINAMTETERNTPFDFSADSKKKEAHWGRDKNVRDMLIHLYEWHQLVLNWIRTNQQGKETAFLPKPYNWKTIGAMNKVFWEKHQNTSLEDATEMYTKSHQDVMELVNTFTNEELFSKDRYKWVGGSTLGSYFISSTSSHYDWAMKKLKAHCKMCKMQ